jgi:hypothetical protein
MEMTRAECQEIKTAVTEAMREEMKDFYIDRETHYQDHMFMKSIREFMENCKVGAIRTVVGTVVLFILGGMAMAVYFLKSPIKG